MTWTLAARTLAAFLVWNLLAWPVSSAWSGVVAEIVEFLWNVVTPHGQSLKVTMSRTLGWRWSPADIGGSLAPGMLTWNVVLYMTAWSIVPGVSSSTRVRWVVVAAPVLALWHVADLLLTVESHLLTLTRPDSYDISAGAGLWFLGVKFAHNLSVLGLRQVIPLLLLAAQWLHWRRGENENTPII